jgi:hypothetical protein
VGYQLAAKGSCWAESEEQQGEEQGVRL